ncbi:hypothetical protein RRG08_022813 [Elysia crispata]|uniref:Uncharacterized protein n=1 Tax=Elysia crispata TaxID=231223 RepID=A0AAE1D8P7_9GAST|nr:hypothetical protein RRG08_022813 [Elysia crispata]
MSINSGQESRNRELALCAARGGGSRRYGLLFSGYFRQTQKIYVHFFPKEERRGELSRGLTGLCTREGLDHPAWLMPSRHWGKFELS